MKKIDLVNVQQGTKNNYRFSNGNAVKVIYVAGEVNNVETLLVKKTLQIGLSEPNVCQMRGRASIVLDFSKELSGGVRVLAFGVRGTKTVRLRFGESVGEACAELKENCNGEDYGGYGTTNDHSNRDMYVDLQSYSDMTFGQTGYRFLRIDTLGDDTEILLKTIVAAVSTDTRKKIGSFECDDSLVNQIWDTAAYTVRLCIQNGYIWDGVKRDRLVWIGDLYPEVRAAHCVFGCIPEMANCLDFSIDQSPLPIPINNMPTYSLWWLISLEEIYRMSSEKSSFIKYLPYINGILEQIVRPCVFEDGTVDYGNNFIDWPSSPRAHETGKEKKEYERKAGVAFLTKIAVTAAKNFLLACRADCSLCDKLLACIAKKDYEIRLYKQMAGLGVWSGKGNESMKETLLQGGAKGLSTFQSYSILTAVASFGEYETALSMMKEYYGGMLSVGATTFWEDFDLEWLDGSGRLDEMPQEGVKDIHGDFGKFCYSSFRHSLCHGWSAGVIPYLTETVAGIKIIGTDMRRIAIEPHLSGLKHVKVNFPTPYGVLTVEHELQTNGDVKTAVSAPREIEIV